MRINREEFIEYIYWLACNSKNEEYFRIYYHAFLTLSANYNDHLTEYIYKMIREIDREIEHNEPYWTDIYIKMLDTGLKIYNDAQEWQEQETTINDELEEMKIID